MLSKTAVNKKANIGRIVQSLGMLLLTTGLFFLLSQRTIVEANEVGGAYITTSPAGALVQLDNEPVGTTPLILNDLAPGDHYLKIIVPGYAPTFTTIEIKKDEIKDFKYFLKPMKTALSVNTSPQGADIYLDGKFIGRSPKRLDDLLVVDHWIKINQSGFQIWEKQLKFEEGKRKELNIDLDRIPPPDDHKQQNKNDCQTECHDVSQAGTKVTINSTPTEATVYLKGEAKGETPLSLYLYPGKYRLHVQKNDYIPQEKVINVDFKQDQDLQFQLEYNQSWKNMVYVPAGEFIMGSDGFGKDEKPAHKVDLDAFYIDKYEVTNQQYRQFVIETGHRQPAYPHEANWSGKEQPVIGISWEDAAAYAKWAGKRLPTEAEWEKAAKGLKIQRYPWGDEWKLRSANTIESGKKMAVKVGSYPYGVSPFGAYDMLGNVEEWCSDWYSEKYYQQSPQKNPKGPKTGRTRVIRGGSWNDKGESITVTTRKSLPPQVRLNTVGFRCVNDLP